jgi:hypothetical protein
MDDDVNGHVDQIVSLKDKKQLVLPTKELLENKTDWDKYVAFHPCCESVLSKQSDVLNALTVLVNSKIARVTMQLAANLIDVGSRTEIQTSLGLTLSELIEGLNYDKATTKLIAQIANKNTQFTGNYPLVALRLDRGGVVDEVKYSRTCTIVQYFNSDEKTICGCTPSSKTANTTVREIFKRVLPTTLVYGNNDQHFPYLMALLDGYYRCAQKLNTVNKVLGKYSVVNTIDLSWHDYVDDLYKTYKRCLPQSLGGNVGKAINSRTEKATETPTADVVVAGVKPTPVISPNDNVVQQPTVTTPVSPFTLNIPTGTPLESQTPINRGYTPQPQTGYGGQRGGGYPYAPQPPQRPTVGYRSPVTQPPTNRQIDTSGGYNHPSPIVLRDNVAAGGYYDGNRYGRRLT